MFDKMEKIKVLIIIGFFVLADWVFMLPLMGNRGQVITIPRRWVSGRDLNVRNILSKMGILWLEHLVYETNILFAELIQRQTMLMQCACAEVILQELNSTHSGVNLSNAEILFLLQESF